MPIAALVFGLALARATDVVVPFRLTDEAIIVDATVNGKPVSLMFDSGFSGAVVLNDAIDIGAASGKATVRDFVGEMEVDTVDLKSLSIGPQKVDASSMHAILQPLARMSNNYNIHADGLLGLRPLEGYVTEINFQKNAFIFHPRSLDISKRAPDGKNTFLTKLLPIGTGALVMSASASNGNTMTLGLDTGNAFFATTHRDVLERLGLWTDGKHPLYQHASQIATGAVDSWSARLKDLTIFGVPVPESIWDVIERPSSQAESDGTVGYQFLRNFNITFDFERRVVWFEHYTDKVGSEAVGETGIYAAYDRNRHKCVVYDVAPDSPADKAGVLKEDELISIGDRDLTNEHYRQLKKLLAGPVGSKIEVAISRDGDLKRFNLDRRALVNDAP